VAVQENLGRVSSILLSCAKSEYFALDENPRRAVIVHDLNDYNVGMPAPGMAYDEEQAYRACETASSMNKVFFEPCARWFRHAFQTLSLTSVEI